MKHTRSQFNPSLKLQKRYDHNPKSSQQIGLFLFLFLFPLLLAFFTEFIQRENLLAFMEWFSYGSLRFYLSYLVILLVFLFFYAITSRLWIGALFSSLLFMSLGLVNFFKLDYRGDPLMPWDLFLGKEALGILPSIQLKITTGIIFSLLCLILILYTLSLKNEIPLPRIGRLFLGFTSLLLLYLMITGVFLNEDQLKKLNIQNLRWNQAINYKHNGFLPGFLINIKSILIESPLYYSQETIDALLAYYPPEKNNKPIQASVTEETPNIIMIMSESFSDPTQLQNLNFSSDPLPTIHHLQETAISGDLFVSEFGGGTSNTEFEVLTGHKTMFLPTGATPYQQYLKKETFALPNYLKTLGYDTLAIHPYEKWFWARDKVYTHLGFNAFIGDVDFIDPIIKEKKFISDESAVKEVIQHYESQKETGSPLFTFLVTMENHGSYSEKEYSHLDVTLSSEALPHEKTTALNQYVQGVYNADTALDTLIKYFSNIEEPTVIIMFGDHRPSFGSDYETYRDLNYISQGELQDEDYHNLYTTPFVLWKNTSIEKENLGLVDANMLTPTLFNKIGIPLPEYWEILLENQYYLPNQNNYIKIEKNGKIHKESSEEEEKVNALHWLMQYDEIFGKQGLKDFF